MSSAQEWHLAALTYSLNQLPYLDSKHEYLWGGRRAAEIAQRDIPTIRADKAHTVRSLTGKLLELVRIGMADSGFPVVVKETVDAEGRTFSAMRVVGFLGMNELEHALCELTIHPLTTDPGESVRTRADGQLYWKTSRTQTSTSCRTSRPRSRRTRAAASCPSSALQSHTLILGPIRTISPSTSTG